MKKLLLGSALAASVLLAGSSYAETKVSGYLETTVTSKETKTAGVSGNSTPQNIGHEASIDLKTSKELDNGFTMSAGFGMQDGTQVDQFLKLSTGNTTFAVGSDVTGVADNVSQEDFTPHIAQSFHDVGNGGLSGVKSVHGGNAFYLIQKMDILTFEGAYAPTQAGGTAAGSSTNGVTGSGYDLAVHGNLGVEGLKVGYGVSEESPVGDSSRQQDSYAMGIKYAISGFTVGYGTSTNTNVSNVSTQNQTAGISYKISDALSLGVYAGTVEKDGTSNDEENYSTQLGYDFGGLGLTVGYYTAEDIGGVRGTDAETFEVRTVTKF